MRWSSASPRQHAPPECRRSASARRPRRRRRRLSSRASRRSASCTAAAGQRRGSSGVRGGGWRWDGIGSRLGRHWQRACAPAAFATSGAGAIATVPRHLFMEPGLASQAYEDAALPIGHQQTISKPSVVARMIELLREGMSSDQRWRACWKSAPAAVIRRPC
jgi:protein-L-isoaspartate(D-aspartate) O-methyltransferase